MHKCTSLKCHSEHHEMVWALEGTFKGYLVQLPYNDKGHLQPDQDPQSSVQPDLNVSRDRHPPPLQATCASVSSPTLQKNVFLVSNLNQTFLSLKPLYLVQPQQALLKSLSPSSVLVLTHSLQTMAQLQIP